MTQRLLVSALTMTGVGLCLSVAHTQEVRQPGAVYDFDRPGEKPEPAPRRDISGIWIPAEGAGVGNQVADDPPLSISFVQDTLVGGMSNAEFFA